jgi:nitrogen PTS system EIIA component
MSNEDLNIDELAAYLHLMPAQVQRMADRGQLPGRRIGGQWRFSQAEIHHWLEDRIGASDEEELVAMEGVLDRYHGAAENESLADMIPAAAIEPALNAKTRSSVIDAMTQLAANTGLLWDADKMAEAVRTRENLHPTALDNGVALLHPRRPLAGSLSEAFIALAKTPGGVYFGGPGGGLTDVFFLVCSVSDAGHLQTLARLSRLLAMDGFLDELRTAESAASMLQLIRKYEAEL